ncbi:hypothetical protein F0L68_18590 [Solihabitans fulvus]|uniref:Uncharacterized protein n=1 Tax=Solihabitans fulvus TaxID=1892852 RepID=A0A5B2XDK6_9PSEU|nr:hypothetical protein [Solihabitans fulvus]KAA2261070.1 hypothetical protein F0L68_18590 [Solihabitans fulvus]
MELESVTDELYQGPRDAFIPVRAERARQARVDGDRALADAIAALRKPTVAAWLVNRVARRHPEDLDRLVALADSLRRAHQNLAGDQIRALSRERAALLRVLGGHAAAAGEQAGVPVTDQVAAQVQETFAAVLQQPDAADAIRAGRLATALKPASALGFPVLSIVAGTDVPEPQPPRRKATPQAELDRRRKDERDRAAAISTARHQVRQAEEARTLAARELAEARAAVSRADSTVAESQERLRQARDARQLAEQDATAATRAFDTADQAVTAAEQALAALERPPG